MNRVFVSRSVDKMSKNLYTSAMSTLGRLLGSSARTETLRVLRFHPEAIGVRELSRLAGIYPRSAELALVSLVKDGLVARKRKGRRDLYCLNYDHADCPVVLAVVDAGTQAATKSRCAKLQSRGRMLLRSVEQAASLISHGRNHRS